ncbi:MULTISPECIES: tyrosine--tRNA ligase [Rhodomicrobium]|uniref:tyrosine--tRNA ligase n=1 Tax=Rhodomicrobium TaxID=1068 RepID=UPI000B4B819E|nr:MULTISPECIES: tyrosine--tRNA ligase [Rhodomicrobium]
MTSLKSDFINTLQERGYIHQSTDLAALDALAASQIVTAYIGFDCTAPSLHIGNLIGIMMLRRLQQTGHRPIALIGGGTTKVGDPSGKDEGRKMLTQAQIDENKAGIRKVFGKFLSFGDGPKDALMVDNDDWLSALRYIDFLREYGPHFTINRMLTFDSVKLRLEREQPLTFLEFNYMILQAYDYVELFRRHGCKLQMGGSDQWGNIINGVELGRRTENAELFGLTTPLLTTASGAKMGKTAQGAVWLNAEMLSPYDYWQFWRNAEDADVGRFLKLFTDLPLAEIGRLEALQGAEINDAKIVLATEATALAHGREAAEAAAETARRTFSEGAAAEGLPTVELPMAELEAGLGVLTALVKAGLATSNGEARRAIQGGGARINDAAVADERATLTAAQVNADGVIKLSLGKKRHVLIKPV